jgi:hypothetical protein
VKTLGKLIIALALFSGVVRTGFSRGDKIIPQVVNGPGWSTKFDLTNISPDTTISNMRLSFYTNSGAKWTLPTNQGTNSDFTLTIGPRQTLRFETSGGSTMGAGYAVIYDEEPLNSEYSDNYVLGISVFYTQSNANGILDTVTVSVPQPTAVATLPMQTNSSQGIYSGLAIVNRSATSNNVQIALYNESGGLYGTKTFTLAVNEQRAEYLHQNLFPEFATQNQKGMAEITADGPFALLGLLQTTDVNGNAQYSTLVPVDKESLRRNTYMVLLQAFTDSDPYMPLDIDGFAADYFRVTDGTEDYPWDLEYRYASPDYTNRWLHPLNGAAIASMGLKNNAEFDAISLPQLKALANYTSTGTISLNGSNLQETFTFAIRTDIGNYAKVRIRQIVDTTRSDFPGRVNEDLILEVCIYK